MQLHPCFVRAAGATAVVCVASTTASAAITQIQGGGLGGAEPAVWNVLNNLVGGGASLSQSDVNTGGINIGGVTGLSRVDDDFDRLFTGTPVSVTVEGLFFSNPDINNPFNGVEHDLYFENETTLALAEKVTDDTSVIGPITTGSGDVWSLTAVRGNATFNGTQDLAKRDIASSIPSENVSTGDSGPDRMVTFSVDLAEIPTLTSLNGQTIDLVALAGNTNSRTAYIHFFDTGSDADFQDAVYITVGTRNIPTPGALALASIAGIAAFGRRRRRN